MANPILGDGGLGNGDAQLRQLAMHAGSSPERVGPAHVPYQLTCVVFREKLSSASKNPGPRGSPQDPQASDASAAAAAPFPLLTAKTESCFSSLSLSQEGQRGASSLELRTSDSKRLSHSKAGVFEDRHIEIIARLDRHTVRPIAAPSARS